MCFVFMGCVTTDLFRIFSSDVDAKLIKDPDVIILIHPGTEQAIVLVNHVLAIEENNKHDLTSTFLLLHFLQSRLTLMQPDG